MSLKSLLMASHLKAGFVRTQLSTALQSNVEIEEPDPFPNIEEDEDKLEENEAVLEDC